MNRAFIIHGWEGKPEEGWFPWLENTLEKEGWQVSVPAMPHPILPTLPDWLATLSGVVGKPDEHCYFIGHSLGCITILKYLETLPENQKVGGVIMVAGFAGHLKHKIKLLQPFYKDKLNWPKVKAQAKAFVAIGSKRDDLIHIESLDEFQTKLGAKVIIDNNWLHFSGVEGITELPEVLNSLRELSSGNKSPV